jgi:preprotein translocase subunit SecG
MLYTLTIILIAIICVVLIITILLQSGQGSGLSGGMAGNAGGGAGNMAGSRRTADFLSKSTSALGGAFLVLCLLANFLIEDDGARDSVIQRNSGFQETETPQLQVPQEQSNDMEMQMSEPESDNTSEESSN